MNKRGNTSIVVAVVIIILMGFGLKGCFEEDIPEIIEKLQNEICVPIKNQWSVCFTNQSGVIINGKFDNLKLNLRTQNYTTSCNVGSGIFKFETVCKDEFGYIYEKDNFTLDFMIDGEYIKSIPQYQIYSLFYRILNNPKVIGKNVWKTLQGALILRGIIYIVEHPEIFNNTSN